MTTCEIEQGAVASPEGLWGKLYEEMCQCIESVFMRVETRERAKLYIKGLLSQIERKNGWQLAEEIGESNPYAVQYFLNRASWDADDLRDILLEYVCERFGDENGVGVLDETGFAEERKKVCWGTAAI